MRLDIALVERGMANTRSAAQHMVAAGAVFIDGVLADKPSRKVSPGAVVTTDAQLVNPFVSRGGLKLADAIRSFDIAVAGRTALDVGASTGGFTDVLLNRGAKSVVALDVGHSQLHPSLRIDERVHNLEGTNVRDVSAMNIGGPFSIVVVDVSFISLGAIADVLVSLTERDLVVLVKPQFEVGRAMLGKGGVVRKPELYEQVRADIDSVFESRGMRRRGERESPIEGSDGNREFFLWFSIERP